MPVRRKPPPPTAPRSVSKAGSCKPSREPVPAFVHGAASHIRLTRTAQDKNCPRQKGRHFGRPFLVQLPAAVVSAMIPRTVVARTVGVDRTIYAANIGATIVAAVVARCVTTIIG